MSRIPTTDALPAQEWAGVMGQRWLAHLQQFEGMLGPIGQALMSHAAFRAGERVVDVGCGAGGTSIDIAQRVAPEGTVLGIDISPQLVEAAAARARARNLTNVSFRCADATTVSVDVPGAGRKPAGGYRVRARCDVVRGGFGGGCA